MMGINTPTHSAERGARAAEISTLNMGGDDEGRTILVSGVPTDFRLEAIRSYFENKRRSNGGPIKGIPERIQDSGKVIITFESEKDAENVVKKKFHNVSKYKLHVNQHKNLVWQEDAMIVSNGHKDMSEKMLINFLEKTRKLDIVYVFPGRKAGIFLVYCQKEIDFEYVQKMCQKNPLNGNPLKVDTIEEINSVQVKNVSSNVSSESLGSYFGDRKKSSGGDISSIQQETNGTYIVSFKEAFVVLDVCTRDHILQNVELDVQPFWEPFEENIISRQQVYDYLQNLRKDISSKDGTFRSQDIQESEAGKNEMQNESESIISLNSDLGSETEEILNFKYKNCEIVLREGDITTLDTDAIVNAANGRLEHMGGIAAAIVRKGGFEIQAESNEIMKQRRIELKPGEVVSTKAGKLKCKTIIHAVGPVWSNGWNHEIFHLSRAVQNCLLFLEAKSYTSIAIPAISTDHCLTTHLPKDFEAL